MAVDTRTFENLDITKQRYPHPFLDISNTRLPKTIRGLLNLCRSTYYWSPIIRPTIKKLAQYPVTDIEILTTKDGQSKAYKKMFKRLKINNFLESVGINYFVYGNFYTSLVFPFDRKLICPRCKTENPASNVKYKLRENVTFEGVCPKCKKSVNFKAKDEPSNDITKLKLKKWRPSNIEITHNDLTGESIYHYKIPATFLTQIRSNNMDIINKTPLLWLEAVQKKMKLKMNPDNFFHMRNEELVDEYEGYGIPLILSVLPLDFYLKLLRRAQEAIAFEHIFNFRIIFPMPQQNMDPFRMQDLGKWKENIEKEVKKWKKDPNYISIMPTPMGQTSMGGDARSMMVTPEIVETARQIVTGLGIPYEFLAGGMSFSGAPISMRIFENYIDVYRAELIEILDFIVDKASTYFDSLEPTGITMSEFRMADDLSRTQILMRLNERKEYSTESLLKRFKSDASEENKLIMKEVQRNSELMRKITVTEAKIKAEAQVAFEKKVQDLMSGDETRTTGGHIVDYYAQQLSQMDDKNRTNTLKQIEKEMPETFKAVQGKLQTTKIDKPLPDKLPPRREAKAI